MSSTALAPSSLTATQTTVGKNISPFGASTTTNSTMSLTPRKDRSTPQEVAIPQQAGGPWLHPRMDEVLRRRNATNFDSSNAKSILLYATLIVLSLFVPGALYYALPLKWLRAIQPYPTYTLWILRLILLFQIGTGLLPLLRTPDACEDVPLTPQQRKLLGLPPMSRPATPQEKEQYVTPPRFSRSNTPRSSSSSVQAEASGSPLSGRGTPLDGNASFRMSGSGSPFANLPSQGPSSGVRSGGERRRLSYNSNRSSPLSFSEFDSSGTISTPTKEKKASVGLNNKWLYEKGRGSPRGSPRVSLGGSVFS